MADRTVKSPLPPDRTGQPVQQQDLQQLISAAPELARMIERSTTAEQVQEMLPAVPTPDDIAQQAQGVVSRRVASVVNAGPVTVPGLGTADVVLTLTPALKDAGYAVAAPTLTTSATTLLGTVAPIGVVAKTASTLTVRLRNTGATALIVPAGAVTAMAVHPST